MEATNATELVDDPRRRSPKRAVVVEFCAGTADHRGPRFAKCHDHDRGEPAPATAPEIRRRDQGELQRLKALVAAAGSTSKGRAQCAAHHDRRTKSNTSRWAPIGGSTMKAGMRTRSRRIRHGC